MILEDETKEAYGYYPRDLKLQSNKRILASCNECGIVRETSKNSYSPLCKSCVMKGKTHALGCKRSEETKALMSISKKGRKRKTFTEEHKTHMSAARKTQSHAARPAMTNPEIKFKDICKKYLLPFKSVGDGALWLGSANPDFVHNTKKIVVEVFGDYWHSPLLRRNISSKQTREYREKQFKAEGYKTIILWESDVKREDAEKFIMHTLHKEGVI